MPNSDFVAIKSKASLAVSPQALFEVLTPGDIEIVRQVWNVTEQLAAETCYNSPRSYSAGVVYYAVDVNSVATRTSPSLCSGHCCGNCRPPSPPFVCPWLVPEQFHHIS